MARPSSRRGGPPSLATAGAHLKVCAFELESHGAPLNALPRHVGREVLRQAAQLRWRRFVGRGVSMNCSSKARCRQPPSVSMVVQGVRCTWRASATI